MDNSLILGDFYDFLPKIKEKSVDFILCDLPYGVTAPDWDKPVNLQTMWAEYGRVLKDAGTVALFSAQPFTSKLIMSNLKSYRYSWYWIKNQGTNFFHAKTMPIRKVEEICIFYKGNYFPQLTDGHPPTNSAKGCSNGSAYHGTNKRDYTGGSTSRMPVNVLNFKCVDNYSRVHSSQKPVDLCEYLINTYTKENDMVLDNCMGSGSTIVACKNLKRNFIGIEKDEKIYDIAMKRITA